MARHDRVVRTEIESNGGSMFTTASDEFCSAFSIPQQAVGAALDAQIELAAEEWGEVGVFWNSSTMVMNSRATAARITNTTIGQYFSVMSSSCLPVEMSHG
jgi:class 3 adenylate cyclase